MNFELVGFESDYVATRMLRSYPNVYPYQYRNSTLVSPLQPLKNRQPPHPPPHPSCPSQYMYFF